MSSLSEASVVRAREQDASAEEVEGAGVLGGLGRRLPASLGPADGVPLRPRGGPGALREPAQRRLGHGVAEDGVPAEPGPLTGPQLRQLHRRPGQHLRRRTHRRSPVGP